MLKKQGPGYILKTHRDSYYAEDVEDGDAGEIRILKSKGEAPLQYGVDEMGKKVAIAPGKVIFIWNLPVRK